MFRNREDEVKRIEEVINMKNRNAKAILLYGRRRVGKTALLEEIKKRSKITFIYFSATESKFEFILSRLSAAIAEETGEDFFRGIKDIHGLLAALKLTKKRYVIAIDEYQYMKDAFKDGNLDSVFQAEIQQLSDDFTFIFSGSYISEMKKMAMADEPLYGRFQLVINLKPFDYLDAGTFYDELTPYEKISFYSIFGGYPFVLDYLDPEKGLIWNIEHILLDTKGYVYNSIRYALLKEIFKIDTAEAILLKLGNGKSRNSELAAATSSSAASISIEIKRLIEMEIISRTFPINRKNEEKKTFYEISDNLIRFFYTYILPNENEIDLRGQAAFYRRFIEPSIKDFIARRFEKMIPEYLQRLIRLGEAEEIIDIGTYWYDIPKEKRNGEFDCVIKMESGYCVIECKYLKDKMNYDIAIEEERKIREINLPDVKRIGFASANGFSFTSKDYWLISGEDLYKIHRI